jgi:Ca2+-binding RTX toxin-like protein
LAGELLYGFTGDDTINGVGGDDSIDGGAGNDTLNGGAGNDTYNIYDGTGGSDVIIDSSGIDTVNWYRHHDGQGHFDINVSRGGANDADLVVTASQHGVVKQTTTIVGQFSSNTPVIETIVKNPDDNPDIYSFINSLNGTINNDFVVGTNSNDILNGDDGQDLLFGGNGNDTLNGGDRGDKLYGGLGNDSLVGGGGDDQLSSGYGNDKLVGGTGDDEYELYPQKGSSTSGSNTIEESQNEGNDWIYISDAYNVDMTRSNNGKDLVISAYQNGVFVGVNTVVNQYSVANSVAVENYSLWLDGSDKTWAFINSFNGNPTQIINELLVGASSNDTLNGYGGDDLLFGGGGNDTLSGGAGDDALDGGDGNDIAVYQGIKSDYIMNKNSDGSWTVTDSVLNRDGVDTLTNIEKLQFSDQLYTLIDTTPPIVSNFTPSDGATAITMESNIVLTFSEAIQKGTGDICLRIGSATGTIIEQFDAENSNRLLISGNTLTIDPTSSLVNDTNYFVTFGSGTVKDLAGNVYAGMNGYDFTTGSNLTSGKHTISVIVDKGVLSSNAVLLKELTENISTTNGLVTNHTVEYSGVTFDYNQIDSLITTVTRDGEFTSEFNKEINDYVQEELNISYKAAVTLVGVQNIDNIIVLVAGADGNYVV